MPGSFEIERISPLATRSKQGLVVTIDAALVRRKAADARDNPRRREIHVLHSGDEDPLQRMLNALQPGSFVTPHRHLMPPKAESLVLLQGSVGFVVFDDQGRPREDAFTLLSRESGVLGIDCRPGVWHTFFALEEDTVVFEVKPGPYVAQRDKEFPSWAPREADDRARSYLAALEDRFRAVRGLEPRRWG